MNCDEARCELTGFHFGTLTGATRDALEAHLTACPACLGEYLALKRAAECVEDLPPPSELSRARLRRAIADELRRARRWSWWERPLVVGVAAASVWLALGAAHAAAVGEGRAPFAALGMR